jgi:hypothetical protein
MEVMMLGQNERKRPHLCERRKDGAPAKKVSAMRMEEYFRERAQRADRGETLRILDRAGR